MISLKKGEKIEAKLMVFGGDDSEMRNELGILGK